MNTCKFGVCGDIPQIKSGISGVIESPPRGIGTQVQRGDVVIICSALHRSINYYRK